METDPTTEDARNCMGCSAARRGNIPTGQKDIHGNPTVFGVLVRSLITSIRCRSPHVGEVEMSTSTEHPSIGTFGYPLHTRRGILWKWSFATTGAILLVVLWQVGS